MVLPARLRMPTLLADMRWGKLSAGIDRKLLAAFAQAAALRADGLLQLFHLLLQLLDYLPGVLFRIGADVQNAAAQCAFQCRVQCRPVSKML